MPLPRSVDEGSTQGDGQRTVVRCSLGAWDGAGHKSEAPTGVGAERLGVVRHRASAGAIHYQATVAPDGSICLARNRDTSGV